VSTLFLGEDGKIDYRNSDCSIVRVTGKGVDNQGLSQEYEKQHLVGGRGTILNDLHC